jgi:H+/Cl- antiporter ClcA
VFTGDDYIMNTIKEIVNQWKDLKLKLAFEGILVGFFSGFIVVFYRLILEKAEKLRNNFITIINGNISLIIIWFILLIFLAIVVGLMLKKDPMIGGSGIPQVEGILAGKLSMNWFSVLIRKFIGGTICIGAGLSVGREGPSIQLGAAAAQGLSKILRRSKMEEKYLITSGASAGLAAAFNAPLAGTMFCLEEMHKHFSPLILLSSMSSALTADFISKYFFGLKPVFSFGNLDALPLSMYGYLVLLGIVIGLFGVFYNSTTMKTLEIYNKIKFLKSEYKPLIPFIISGLLVFILPEVLGGGHNLVESLTSNNFTIKFLFILLICKFIFSMISFGSGVPGGIFFPLLVLGALTGCIYGNILSHYFNVNPVFINNFIIFAMAGYFSAIVRAPITGSILITEMTGSFSHLLSLSIVSIIAYVVADVLKSEPIYESLLNRILKNSSNSKDNSTNTEALNNTIIEIPVFIDSDIDGKMVKDLNLPQNCLLIGIKRGKKELIPRGNSKIYAGDYLLVLLKESYEPIIKNELLNL